MTTPLLSFIVLSYNYQEYVKTTIQSILNQTVQDFEIVVVDDASADNSCDAVRSFNDPRIRLIVNERNLGGAGAYNVAVSAARGVWLVNLDADDWIAPSKSARQLNALIENPHIDIIGTWVNLVDSEGEPHPGASSIEPLTNDDHDFNLVDTWIRGNYLCRSTTMVRRATHLRIGLDDPGMVAAPDYELWTRALGQGCRFHLLKERLTFMRLHSRGVTHADPLRSLREISFVLSKNIGPLIERRALPVFFGVLKSIATHPQIPFLAARERHRLFGILMAGYIFPTYEEFHAALSSPDDLLESMGRRALFASTHLLDADETAAQIMKLNRDIELYIEARDYFKSQSEAWKKEAECTTKKIARARWPLSRYFRSS